MKKYLFILLSAGILLTGCCRAENHPAGIRHFYVIGVDAMSVEGLKQAHTPNMDKLIADGAVCYNVRTVQPSSSSPNWGSMLMGAGPEIHGNSSNDWRTDNFSLAPAAVTDYGMFPSVVSVVKAQKPDGKIGMLYHWDGFGNLFEKGVADFDQNYPTEKETAEAIAAYIKKEKPLFVFSQLDDVDHVGHAAGHMTDAYLKAIGQVDSLVGVIVEATREAGIIDETVFMIVSDHGGIGNSHGGTTLEESTVPFILSGKGVKKGFVVPAEVYMYDVAPTITYALGLDEPYAWRGKAMRCAFENEPVPVDPLPVKQLTNDVLINGGRHGFEQAGGLYIDQPVVPVEITSRYPDAKIFYTTDGSVPTAGSSEYKAPFTVDKSCVVRARSFSSHGESIVTDGFFRLLKSNPDNGVSISFYKGRDWTSVPDFSKLTPAGSWTAHEVRIDRRKVQPLQEKGRSSFALLFRTALDIEKEGEYTFYLQSDDGSVLYVDGKQVVNNDGDHGVIEKEGSIKLTAGRHDLSIGFVNVGGGYWIEAFYKGPGFPKQIIPADKLYLKQ